VKALADKTRLSTRQVILEAIKQANEATVDELSHVADVSPVTVRHHLNSLLAEGLLTTRSIRRKVGRPFFVYSLTELGHEMFPQRYVSLSSRLLDELKTRFPSSTVVEVLSSVVDRIADEHREEFESLDFEGRLDYLVRLLTREGFLASWELTDHGYVLTEYSCPYYSVGQKHSEVCTFDRQLISIILETPFEQHRCVLNGDSCCQFSFATGS
jgi:predicted ArsR family transcriptional regulator